jgi:hypothetical protein
VAAKVRILAVTLAKPLVQRIYRASYLGHHPGGKQLHVSAEGRNTINRYNRCQSVDGTTEHAVRSASRLRTGSALYS